MTAQLSSRNMIQGINHVRNTNTARRCTRLTSMRSVWGLFNSTVSISKQIFHKHSNQGDKNGFCYHVYHQKPLKSGDEFIRREIPVMMESVVFCGPIRRQTAISKRLSLCRRISPGAVCALAGFVLTGLWRRRVSRSYSIDLLEIWEMNCVWAG